METVLFTRLATSIFRLLPRTVSADTSAVEEWAYNWLQFYVNGSSNNILLFRLEIDAISDQQ